MDDLLLAGISALFGWAFLFIIASLGQRYAKKIAKAKKAKILADKISDRVKYEKLRSRNEYYNTPDIIKVDTQEIQQSAYEKRQVKYIRIVNENVTKNSKQLAKAKYEELRNLKNVN